MIRMVLLLTLLGIPLPAAGQSPAPDFVSPTRSAHGFVMLRYTATEQVYRYYDIDANTIRIMNGPYSTTVAATIPLEANETSSTYVWLAFVDMSGDGFNDLGERSCACSSMSSCHGSSPGTSLRPMATQEAQKVAILDWSQCPAVESVAGTVGGAWVFRDTCLPVATVIENLEDRERRCVRAIDREGRLRSDRGR